MLFCTSSEPGETQGHKTSSIQVSLPYCTWLALQLLSSFSNGGQPAAAATDLIIRCMGDASIPPRVHTPCFVLVFLPQHKPFSPRQGSFDPYNRPLKVTSTMNRTFVIILADWEMLSDFPMIIQEFGDRAMNKA